MGAKFFPFAVSGILILVACTPAGSHATTTTQPPRTTTTVPVPSEACSNVPDTPLDADRHAVESMTADIDGDGFDDRLTGYLQATPDPTAAAGALIHVELASGWGTAFRVDELALSDGPAIAEPAAVVTLGDDQLLVVAVTDTPQVRRFAFFVFDQCELAVVDTEDGEIPELWIGGGRTHDDWFVCETDRVSMVQFGTSNPDADPRVYGAGAARTYEYVGGEFNQVRSGDVDGVLPATRQELTGVYPPCVP